MSDRQTWPCPDCDGAHSGRSWLTSYAWHVITETLWRKP